MPHKLPPGLYAILDDTVRPEVPMIAKARAVAEAEIGVLQLRLKQTADQKALSIVREAVGLVGASGPMVIVNDRVDLALVGGAHGVHLGEVDLPIDAARKLLGPRALIGATTRNWEDMEQAKALGADYVGLGPLFPTHTKIVDQPPLGIERFRELTAKARLPVVGIAGIALGTIGQVAASGAWGAAVCAGLFSADDLVSRARALQEAFFQHR